MDSEASEASSECTVDDLKLSIEDRDSSDFVTEDDINTSLGGHESSECTEDDSKLFILDRESFSFVTGGIDMSFGD
jgi:hypothetical protein